MPGMTLANSPCMGDGFFGTPGNCLRDGENSLQYPGDDCGGEVHCLGQLSMGALWKMRKNLITTFGDTLSGAAHADSLFRFAMMGRPYTLPDLLIEMLTADDDDGFIYNGTSFFSGKSSMVLLSTISPLLFRTMVFFIYRFKMLKQLRNPFRSMH